MEKSTRKGGGKYGDKLTVTLYENESKSGGTYFRGSLKGKASKNIRQGEEIVIYFATTANIMQSKFGRNENVILLNVSTPSI